MKKFIPLLFAAVMVLIPASAVKASDYADQVYTGVINEAYEAANDPLYAEYVDEELDITSVIEWGKEIQHAASKAYTKQEYGIDVSKYQTDIDWVKVKESGVEFAIIRLGYRGMADGKLTLDPYFERNITGAYNAGIKVGVYFYTQAISKKEAKAEADFCADILSAYPGYLSYPVMFDIENTSTDRMGKAKLSTSKRTDICKSFCEETVARELTPGVYSYKNYFETKLNMSELEYYYIWLANFAKSTSYMGKYDMWQYSDNAKSKDDIVKVTVDGIEGAVDLDVAYTDTPAPVTELKLKSNTDSSVKLNWKQVTKRDGYQICVTDMDGNLITEFNCNSNTKTVANLLPGKKYAVKVRAYYYFYDQLTLTENYIFGAYSSELTVCTKPAKVIDISVKKYGKDYVTLKWAKVDGATGYKIYQYNNKSKKYEVFKSTKKTSYKIKKLSIGTKYKYKIMAYKKFSDKVYEGAKSSVFVAATKLTKISGLKIKTNKASSITVTWPKKLKASGYELSVYSSKGKLLNTYSTKKTSYTVKKLEGSTTYKFKVRAYIKTDSDFYAYSDYSSAVSGKTIPKQVKDITVKSVAKDKIKFKWTKASGIKQFKVYSYDSSTKKKTLLATTTKSEYTMKDLVASKKYGIIVEAYTKINGKYVSGKASEVFTVYTQPDKVKGLSIKSTTETTVSLSWKKLDGVKKYRIYIYDSFGGLITTIDTKSASYTVTDLAVGAYCFKVAALKTTDDYITAGPKSAEVTTSVVGIPVEPVQDTPVP